MIAKRHLLPYRASAGGLGRASAGRLRTASAGRLRTASAGRLALVGPLAIVLVCVALAAPVLAFASRATHGVVVRKRSRGAATATCPKGEHVSFGGVVAQFSPPPGSGPSVFPTGMRRTADNHWTVYGESGTDVIGSRLTAVAYCDRGAVPRVASNTVSMPGFRSASAIATCPAGTSLVGGGYNSGASSTHVEAVARLDALSSTKWLVTMINLMPTATTVTAIAYCASGKPLTVVSTLLKVAGRRGGTARVSCPGGTSLVFGGLLASSAQSGSHLSAVLPFSWTAETTKQWVVTGYNVGDLPAYLTAIGYCR